MGFAGLNITFPCKQAVIPLLDALSEEARAIGAVNTVVREGDRLVGYNTDGPGWSWGFRRALPKADLSRVVLLGAGGAGAAVAPTRCCAWARRSSSIFDRRSARAAALASRLNQHFPASARAATRPGSRDAGATGLIHATPDRHGEDARACRCRRALLRPSMWVSEIVYVPLETELLKAARRAGCATVDGGHMNVGQAIARLQAVHRPGRRRGAHGRAIPAPGFVLSKTRIAVAGAGSSASLTWPRRRARVHASASSIRRRARGDRGDGRRSAVPFARRAAPRTIGPTASSSRRRTSCMSSRHCNASRPALPMLLEKPIAPTVAEGERLVAAADRAGARILIGHHRAHSPIMAKAKQIDRRRRARPAGRRDGQRDVLQAGPLLRGRAVATRAGRRADPDQHDPRGAQPAHAVRRDRRRAGVRVARRARIPGRGHGRDRPSLRERCAGDASCFPTPPRPHATGSTRRARTRRIRSTTTRTAT